MESPLSQFGISCFRFEQWRVGLVAVLVVLGGACARNVAMQARPPEVTWDAFMREVECASRAGYEIPGARKDVCLRKSFEGLVAADENAHCSRDADCSIVYDWPPLGPLCLPVRYEWKTSRAYRELHEQLSDYCGILDSLGLGPKCVVACVGGRCVVPGRVTLILASPDMCSAK